MKVTIVGLPKEAQVDDLRRRIRDDVKRGARQDLGFTVGKVDVVFTEWPPIAKNEPAELYYSEATEKMTQHEAWLLQTVLSHVDDFCVQHKMSFAFREALHRLQ